MEITTTVFRHKNNHKDYINFKMPRRLFINAVIAEIEYSNKDIANTLTEEFIERMKIEVVRKLLLINGKNPNEYKINFRFDEVGNNMEFEAEPKESENYIEHNLTFEIKLHPLDCICPQCEFAKGIINGTGTIVVIDNAGNIHKV